MPKLEPHPDLKRDLMTAYSLLDEHLTDAESWEVYAAIEFGRYEEALARMRELAGKKLCQMCMHCWLQSSAGCERDLWGTRRDLQSPETALMDAGAAVHAGRGSRAERPGLLRQPKVGKICFISRGSC
jgi:hypothetical protein